MMSFAYHILSFLFLLFCCFFENKLFLNYMLPNFCCSSFYYYTKNLISFNTVIFARLANISTTLPLRTFVREKSRKMVIFFCCPSPVLNFRFSLIQISTLSESNIEREVGRRAAGDTFEAIAGEGLVCVEQSRRPVQRVQIQGLQPGLGSFAIFFVV
jgi:hypothetical protein